ncbi:MAG: hypothetical protein KAJ51_05740 [Thermoplasmata archaeon]|nr:hypothetical protein [Thermoplasmata archaeon]
MKRAKRDYSMARGTQHLKQTRQSIVLLRMRRNNNLIRINEINNTLNQLEQDKYKEILLTADNIGLSRRIAEKRLQEAHGIGKVLKNKIIYSIFNGNLDSLYGADRLYGIGYEKARAIHAWVDKIKTEMPQLLETNFPKEYNKITAKYANQKKVLKKEQSNLLNSNSNMNTLEDKAAHAEKILSSVTPSTFKKSYKNDLKSSKMVNNYLIGVFPEWGQMPGWYKTLISEYSG